MRSQPRKPQIQYYRYQLMDKNTEHGLRHLKKMLMLESCEEPVDIRNSWQKDRKEEEEKKSAIKALKAEHHS